ncbi:MAG: glycosyltransferase family 39 protein [Anaerolineae bacterium]|nr:glycosyltransferase family 39 protein [Anaerolineae bacterium]
MNKTNWAKRASPLLLILLLALGLRLIALGSRTLWYDEAFAVLFSEKGLNAMLYGTLTPVAGVAADVHPLLYYTTLDGWMRLFGQNLAVVRLYGVLLGVATVGMLYLLARDLFEERTGLAAAFIAAITPFHVQYSQEARMYALLGLLLVTATWCFVRGWRTGKARYWIEFGVLAGLSMYAQQLAAFYLIALGLIPFMARRKDQIIRVVLSAGLAILIYLPWLVNLPSQFSKIGNYWIKRPTLAQPFLTLWSYTFADLEVRDTAVVTITLIAFAILLTFLIYRVLVALRRRQRDWESLGLALWLVIAPITLMWLISQWQPVYLTRALLPSGLLFYVVVAWLFTRARLPRPILGVIAVPLLISVGLGLYLHYMWVTFPRPPFDQADSYIREHLQAGDMVVHANKITALPMVYYDRHLPQAYVRDVPGSGEDTLARPTQEVLRLLADDCVSVAAKGSPRVWFVIFRKQIEEQGGSPPDLQWLDAHYQRQSTQAFNDLLVYRYDQPDALAKQATCAK